MGQSDSLCNKFGITNDNLETRRKFIRLGEKERKVLVNLIPWANKYGDQIAKEFYDWQFSFTQTRDFFEQHAQQKKLELNTLRTALEKAQSSYFKNIFTGAQSSWGAEYYENRLQIGKVHDIINVPFKWYIGSYSEYQRLTRKYLQREFDKPSKPWSKNSIKNYKFVQQAEDAISKVFNYDTQAICDSFLMNTIDSIGVSVEQIEADQGADRTEHMQQIKVGIATLLQQATAIAEGKLNDQVLEKTIDGKLGEAFGHIANSITTFLKQIRESSQALSNSATQLDSVSGEIGAHATETANEANTASTSISQISNNIQTVAAAAEEMTASVKEIAQNAGDAVQVANEAVEKAQTTNQSIAKLGDSSTEIGEVVKVITSIAEQTNLLALNATIEAASAGDAGKGFAVVANEVKELAKETAKATEDISRKIEAIQNDTKGAVLAIGEISNIVNQINQFQNTIAAAVEEQNATTTDISRSVNEIAENSKQVESNINSVAKTADNTKTGIADTHDSANTLAQLATTLDNLVAKFEF